MSVCVNITFTLFATFIGTIKNREMFFFQTRSTFKGHGTTNKIVCSFYLIVRKPECFQKAPFEVEILFRFKTKTLKALFTQCIYIEYKPDLESTANGCV